jgi:hypothetical protein
MRLTLTMLLAVIGLSSCSGDFENRLVGTWYLEKQTEMGPIYKYIVIDDNTITHKYQQFGMVNDGEWSTYGGAYEWMPDNVNEGRVLEHYYSHGRAKSYTIEGDRLMWGNLYQVFERVEE